MSAPSSEAASGGDENEKEGTPSEGPLPDGEESDNAEETFQTLQRPREKIARVDMIQDRRTRRTRFVKSAKPKDIAKTFARYVIVVAKVISAHGVFTGEYRFIIRGRFLCEVLTDRFKNTGDLVFRNGASLTTAEVEGFFHAIPYLNEQLANLETKIESLPECPERKKALEQRFELEAGLEFITNHFGFAISKRANMDSRYISYDVIWTIFVPGMVVYTANSLGDGRAYRVRRCGTIELENGVERYEIYADSMDYDGITYGFVEPTQFLISPFNGEVPISELKVYPLDQHPSFHSEVQRLVDRADKAIRLNGQNLQEYNGHGIDHEGHRFNSHGRVMLDPVNCRKFHPHEPIVPEICHPVPEGKMTAEHKLLLNAVLYGFSLGDKTWGSFSISGLQDVVWNQRIIDSLVLPEAKKLFVRGLIRAHGFANREFDDIVRDKGKGIVGLFAGPPGVGKSLTAEVVAEVAQKPLYILSSGELGDNPTSVQERLDRVLELTEAWSAVLLLDEADVFLVKRDNTNLTRNAITSVFLRKLEYYQGILLLTTNRLSSIDDAFQSRVHFCFQYDGLGEEERAQIWQNFLIRARASDHVPIHISDAEQRELARWELNGRQIKNIISTSQTYALERQESITMKTIEIAVGFSQWSSPPAENDTQPSPNYSLDQAKMQPRLLNSDTKISSMERFYWAICAAILFLFSLYSARS